LNDLENEVDSLLLEDELLLDDDELLLENDEDEVSSDLKTSLTVSLTKLFQLYLVM
jgi:hypothetical protein